MINAEMILLFINFLDRLKDNLYNFQQRYTKKIITFAFEYRNKRKKT